jgi:hypothetical protein
MDYKGRRKNEMRGQVGQADESVNELVKWNFELILPLC